MSKRNRQSDHAMLESWRPARGAGDPIGCLTTTFTFDAGFFEEECLARFLEIDSLPDREGLAYLLERENRLGPTYAGVLVDHRQAGVDHSLRWDVLPVRIPRAKQHAKLSLLAWTNRIRIVVSSANLTQSGYRYNHEVSGTVELSPSEAHKSLLQEACSFLETLITFVPGVDDDPARLRARQFLDHARRQSEDWIDPPQRGVRLTRHFAFTHPPNGIHPQGMSSLTECLAVCRRTGSAPAHVRVASPFFDPAPTGETDQVTSGLCSGMARGTKRSITFCVPTIGEMGDATRLAAPRSLLQAAEGRVDRLIVEALPLADKDKNPRPWHAKMLALSTPAYKALMIGSSNFTKAGMGEGAVRNAEANLIYCARKEAFSREGGALNECWPETTPINDPDAAQWQGPQAEMIEEEKANAIPAVPFGFVSARYRAGSKPIVVLTMLPGSLPEKWEILGGPQHDQSLLDSDSHREQGSPNQVLAPWPFDHAPGKLLVRWEKEQAFWPVNVEDQSALPLPREIDSMTAQDMLFILAASDAGAAFRVWARQQESQSHSDDELDSAVPPDLDPLRRYNLQDTFLHRVRRQARLLAAVKGNLERPVWSEQAIQWRLTGMLGVQRLTDRIAKDLDDADGNASQVVLNLSDLLIMLGQVAYRETDNAVSRRRFNRQYKQFLRALSTRLNERIQAVPGLSSDVRQFWRRVHRRVQQ
jgi:hypothetical protein